MGTAVIIIILIAVIFFAAGSSLKHIKGEGGCCGGGAETEKVRRKKLDRVTVVKLMKIEGMSCDNCRRKVENKLNSIEHISAKVHLKKKEALIKMEDEVSDEILRKPVEAAGYHVVSIEKIMENVIK